MFKNPLKLQHNDSHKVFATSDLHKGHNKNFIFEKRGFKSIQEHDEFLISKINECVRSQDSILMLGDIALNTSFDQFNEFLSRINCQNIYYIFGNHESCTKRAFQETIFKEFGRNDIEVYPIRYRNIIFLGNYVELVINKVNIIASHYSHQVWNGMHHGSIHLNAHSHYGNPLTRADYKDALSLDIGFDGHKKPLSFDEIMEIMKTKKYTKIDDHH